MQNNRKENTNTNLTKWEITKQTGFSKTLLWVLGGAAVVFLVKKLMEKFLFNDPPIIIKSSSFVIGTRRLFGDLEEGDSDTEDDDLIDPTYFRRKRINIEVRCVVVFRDGEPIRCVKFHSSGVPRGRCIIKFYFGGCPADPGSRPDILVKGRFLRVRSRRVLEPVDPGHPRYFFRSTPGQRLCAIIFRRDDDGILHQQGESVIFPDDDSVHLVLDSDPSRYPDVC